jgi:hypothetical protein
MDAEGVHRALDRGFRALELDEARVGLAGIAAGEPADAVAEEEPRRRVAPVGVDDAAADVLVGADRHAVLLRLPAWAIERISARRIEPTRKREEDALLVDRVAEDLRPR